MRLILLSLLVFNTINLNSQSCYIDLGDYSGIQNSLASVIEQISCKVKDNLPLEINSNFKVYSYGYYTHQNSGGESFTIANREIMFSLIQDPTNYVLFEIIHSSNKLASDVNVYIKLMPLGKFSCFTDNDFFYLKVKMESIINKENLKFEAIPKVLETLNKELIKMKDCCSPGLTNNCGNCPIVDPLNNIDERPKYLSDIGFESFPISNISNSKNTNTSRNGSISDFSNKTFSLKGETINLKTFFEQVLSEYSYHGWVTDNDDICTRFSEIEEEYSISPNSVWFHINESNNSLNMKSEGDEKFQKVIDFITCFMDLQWNNKYNNLIPLGTIEGPEVSIDASGKIKDYLLCKTFTIIGANGKKYTLNHPSFDKENFFLRVEREKEEKIRRPYFYIVPAHEVSTLLSPIPQNPTFLEKYYFPYKESNKVDKAAGGLMDFTNKYLRSETYRFAKEWGSHYDDWFLFSCPLSENIAFNTHDFGNFLWGAAMHRLGFTISEAKCYADKMGQTQGGPDTPEDQNAIHLGHLNYH